MSLLDQNITRTELVDKTISQLEFNNREVKSDEYEVEAICNSAVYIKELERGQLPGLYYLVSWKDYPEEENT